MPPRADPSQKHEHFPSGPQKDHTNLSLIHSPIQDKETECRAKCSELGQPTPARFPPTNVSWARKSLIVVVVVAVSAQRECEWKFCTFLPGSYLLHKLIRGSDSDGLSRIVVSTPPSARTLSNLCQFHTHMAPTGTWFSRLGAPEQQLTSNCCFVATYCSHSRPCSRIDWQRKGSIQVGRLIRVVYSVRMEIWPINFTRLAGTVRYILIC